MVAATIHISRSSDYNDDIRSTPSSQHNYGTRTRQNSIIKPSARLRQSPDLPGTHRKLKSLSNLRVKSGSMPQTHIQPVFPPQNVMLHSEDANNKVLMAIGRSFLSVDNRAMTIKDLAEMCMKFGLSCQSASAAGQAITSFIRSHMQRCEIEQDQPLLLKHVLTGTPSDDDLVSALHSRSGGAHCTVPNSEHRLTNFRRGTVIWYLSKAAGAPCPFARAGVRLCDYKDDGDVKQERHCGQKRKRSLRARSCRNGSDSEGVGSETEKRAPKVKLTLRLKPPQTLSVTSTPTSISESSSTDFSLSQRSDLSKDSDADDDAMSIEVSEDDDPLLAVKQEESIFPPYPRQSISIPIYTPSVEDLYPELFTPATYSPSFYRSSSVPHSVASPPPDSDDEDDDFTTGVAARRCRSSAVLRPCLSKGEIQVEFGERDREAEADLRIGCESPGPCSPWTTFGGEDGIIVKEESNDVGGILDAWEHVDNISNAKIALFADRSSFDSETGVKLEGYSLWEWGQMDCCESEGHSHTTDETDSSFIKEEDVDNSVILSDKGQLDDDLALLGPLSAIEPSYLSDYGILTDARRHSEVLWKDAELLGPDSVRLQDFEDGDWPQPRKSPSRTRAHTSPSLFASLTDSAQVKPDPRFSEPGAESESKTTTAITPATKSIVGSTASMMERSESAVVHTIRDLTPAICVAQVDGISIYQLIVDSLPLLRRFDTDFVNLSRIAEYLGQPKASLDSVSPVKEVAKGCSVIRGKWVPLEKARNFVNNFPLMQSVLDIFLSGNLFEQFPPCVAVMHRSHQHLRSRCQFGPPFRSMVEDSYLPPLLDETLEINTHWERAHWDDDHLISVHPSLGAKTMEISLPALEERCVPEVPLSPTEQEIFRSFCGSPEWDTPSPTVMEVAASTSEKENEEIRPAEDCTLRGYSRTLRRSKRVADAMASRPRTRSGKSKANIL